MPAPPRPRRLLVQHAGAGAATPALLHHVAAMAEHVDGVAVVCADERDAARFAGLGVVLLPPGDGSPAATLAAVAAIDAEVDELLVVTSDLYGPIGSYGPMVGELASRGLDAWALCGRCDDDEIEVEDVWLAFDLRHLRSDGTAMAAVEAAPTWAHAFGALRDAGRSVGVGFDADHVARRPLHETPAALVERGMPIMSRSALARDPFFHDLHATVLRDVEERMRSMGYPMALLYGDLASLATPRDLYANLSMLEVLPHVRVDPAPSLSVGIFIHVHYPEMTSELLGYADRIAGATVVLTASDEARATATRVQLQQLGRDVEVRVVASNRGRDVAAFLVACRDLIVDGGFDVVVKLHSKRSPQNGLAGPHFKRHLLENLLGSEGYAANLLALFAERPDLGMVFPPMIHIGLPTMGRGWFGNREGVADLAERLGIRVRVDEGSPLATYGSMFVARPAALAPLLAAAFGWDDFEDETRYGDGGLAHLVERLFAYSAISAGFHVRTVMTTEHAAVSHTMLEHKLDAMDDDVPGLQWQQVLWVRHHRGLQRAQERSDAQVAHREATGQRPRDSGSLRARLSAALRRSVQVLARR